MSWLDKKLIGHLRYSQLFFSFICLMSYYSCLEILSSITVSSSSPFWVGGLPIMNINDVWFSRKTLMILYRIQNRSSECQNKWRAHVETMTIARAGVLNGRERAATGWITGREMAFLFTMTMWCVPLPC